MSLTVIFLSSPCGIQTFILTKYGLLTLTEERQYPKFKLNDTELSVNYLSKLDFLDDAVCFGPEDGGSA